MLLTAYDTAMMAANTPTRLRDAVTAPLRASDTRMMEAEIPAIASDRATIGADVRLMPVSGHG